MFGTVESERPLKPYERLRKHWIETDAGVETGSHTESEIRALEARYGIRLPDDFREYVMHSCPRAECGWDNTLTDWWNLSRIRSIREEFNSWPSIENPIILANIDDHLFFADYSLWCWAWAINCGNGEHRGRIAVISGGSDPFVADSFGEFVDRFVQDPRLLL